jgi:hypothetical protein
MSSLDNSVIETIGQSILKPTFNLVENDYLGPERRALYQQVALKIHALHDLATAARATTHVNVKCDGCFCSPIIGTRFNATDRHDFDLCETCVVNRETICPGNNFAPIDTCGVQALRAFAMTCKSFYHDAGLGKLLQKHNHTSELPTQSCCECSGALAVFIFLFVSFAHDVLFFVSCIRERSFRVVL